MDWPLKGSSDLLQNCDLPPPLKLFSPFKKEGKRILPREALKITQWDDELEPNHLTENTGLLRALQLSQSRAREAEKKAWLASNNNEQMAALLLEESLTLSTHQQWVRLLEIEILLLQKKRLLEEDRNEDDAMPALTWCLTLALCLGIGFVLGHYMF